MICVIDASVACKWFLRFSRDEEDVTRALSLLDEVVSGRLPVQQPPHFYAEMGAVLAREKQATAELDLADLLQLDFGEAATPEIYTTALTLSIQLRHHWFDTLYHAVALERQEAILITADRRYYVKARHKGRIQLLSDWPPLGTHPRDNSFITPHRKKGREGATSNLTRWGAGLFSPFCALYALLPSRIGTIHSVHTAMHERVRKAVCNARA